MGLRDGVSRALGRIGSALSRVSRRWWIVSGVGLTVAIAAVVAGVVLLPRDDAAAAETAVTATVGYETFETSVEATGTVTPTVSETVSFSASGTVTSVLVVAGQQVTAGDVLATTTTTQAQADLLEAQADLATAEANYDDSVDEGDSSTVIAANAAKVTLAEEDVADAQAALDATTMVAPVSGMVTSIGFEVGDVVGSSSSGGGASSSSSTSSSSTSTSTSSSGITIVGLSDWTVSVTVGSSDVTSVVAGDQVEFTTDDGDAFFGVVSEVGLLPSTTTGAAAFPVTLRVTGSPDGLYDGVSVTATIITTRRMNVLSIPSAAVSTVDGQTVVTVVADDGSQSQVDVEIGETSGSYSEILSGLAAGDTVTYTPVVQTSTSGTGSTQTQDQTGQFPSGGTGDFPSGGMPGGQ